MGAYTKICFAYYIVGSNLSAKSEIIIKIEMRFSQRIGKKPIKTILQIESIDLDLKNRLWNIILENFFNELSDYHDRGSESTKGDFCKIIWREFYGFPIDRISRFSNVDYINSSGFIDYVRKRVL